MKKIFNYAFAIVLSLGLISCNKQQPEEVIISSQADLERLLSDVYNIIPMDAFNTKDQHTMLATYSKANDYSVNVTGFWDYSKMRTINIFISKLDEALEKGLIDEDTRDQMLGEAIFARAYCYFAMVRRFGGVPIVTEPLKGDPNPGPDYPRKTEKETWDFVISELDRAAELLPDDPSGGKYRASKWAALGLQSRVALYAGTLSKYWGRESIPASHKAVTEKLTYMEASYADAYFAKCIEASEKIIDSKKFSLYGGATTSVAKAKENLTELFLDRRDQEFIFGRSFSDGMFFNTDNGFDLMNSPNQKHGKGEGWGNYSVTSDLVDLFDNYSSSGGRADGTIKTRNDGNEDIYFAMINNGDSSFDKTVDFIKYSHPQDPFLKKDARFQAWVLYPGADFRGVTIVAQGGYWLTGGKIEFYKANSTTIGSKTYYELGAETQDGMSAFFDIDKKGASNQSYFWSTAFGIRKFLDPNKAPDKSANPWYDIRYAEILLNYAEAYAESGKGSSAKAKQALNDIRHRAAFTDDVAPTLENILHERQVEFAFEGHESYTLWRRRAYLSSLKGGPYRKHTVVPVLDLRSSTPRYVFPRVNAYWSDVQNSPNGVSVDQLDYYGAIPSNAGSHLTVNPCQD